MSVFRRPIAAMRWALATAACGLAVVGFVSGCAAVSKKQREAAYQAALTLYSRALTTGMLRKDVEAYLKGRGTPFLQMCCMGTSHNALDDLIKIGEEESPWYCSEHNVYVGLEFVSRATHQLAEAHDADALQTVRIYHWLGGCL